MDISDRLALLALGCAFGFIFGYMVRSLSCIQKDVQQLKKVMKVKNNDDGFMSNRLIADLLMIFVLALTVYASVQSQIASNNSNDATDNLKQSNTVACENANENRSANRQLWDYIFDVSVANQTTKPPPREQRFTGQIKHWIHQIYRPHDCEHLEKKYPIPAPPRIIHFADHKHK